MQDGAAQAGEAAGWHVPEPELLPKYAVDAKLAEYIPGATWQRLYPCAASPCAPHLQTLLAPAMRQACRACMHAR